MLARALIAFLMLPGVFGAVVPWVLVSGDPWRGEGWLAGAGLMGPGLLGLMWCVRDFYVSGRGTLAPWDPPARLVIVGLYRYTRNPMYVSLLLFVGGWSVAAGSPVLAAYAAIVAVAFHLRVILHEEPWCAKTFGPEWSAYSARVPRWVPRFTAEANRGER
ncbi:MAG TPA: isoprenylcysteine carboxylmethyltransferase family protein [Burkholderiales bacterium]|nr:isoprenylcysteine carboxylmethyltransferase family protein [Burkholderiales bacterium]